MAFILNTHIPNYFEAQEVVTFSIVVHYIIKWMRLRVVIVESVKWQAIKLAVGIQFLAVERNFPYAKSPA
jgi:hypothetical protein